MAAFELNNTILKNSANLKAYYRFESGALTTDSSGNGKTLTNNNNITNSAGVFGYCGDGGVSNTNKYLAIQDNLGIAGNEAVSMSFWIKMNTEIASNTQVFLQHMSTLTADRYISCYYDYNAGTRRLTASFSGTNAYFNIVLGTTSWHHVVIVRDVANSVGYLVVDGVKGSTSALGTSTTGINRLSILGAVSDSFLSGMIDDLAVFNTVLTPDQIKELYEGRTVGEGWPQAGLVLGMHLNGNSTDYSGNNNHGTDTAITYSTANGKFGQGAGFNGSSSKIVVPNASINGLKITGAQTWCAWVQLGADTASGKTIIGRSLSNASQLLRLDINPTGGVGDRHVQFQITGLTPAVAQSTTNIDLNKCLIFVKTF